MPGVSIWMQFLLCTAVIGFSGTRLSRYADVLAEKTGLGRTWMGLVVVALVTSLPELANGISAVVWVKAPDLAVGNLLGAAVLNLAILAVADLFYPPGPVLTAADRGHILAAGFGVMLLGVASLALLTRAPLAFLSLGYVSLSSPVLLLCYLAGMHATSRYYRRERAAYIQEHPEEIQELLYPERKLGDTALRFGLHALVVVAVGIWLPRVADDLAVFMGWHLSMVGTIFVALVTTLPEMVVTISALRLGAVDLAVGDLLGSLMINTAMLGLLDFFYFDGPLLRAVAPENAATGLLAIIMTGIAVAELMYRPHKKVLRWMSLGAFILVFLYAGNLFFHIMALNK